MTTETKKGAKGYNFTVTPVSDVESGTTATGKDKIKFRAILNIQGRQVERTIVAQGKSTEFVSNVAKGEAIALRCIFNRAPNNDDGSKGGEFLEVVGKPLDKAA